MASLALQRRPQRNFAAGMFRGVARHLIPPAGLYGALNGLFDDDGSIYRRGGSQYKSTTDFGTDGVRAVYDAIFSSGQRTLFANPSDFGVLDVDDATPVNIGGAGLAAPARAVKVGDIMFIGGVAGAIYGGGRKTGYGGTPASLTQGSAVVGITPGGASANVEPGMLFRVDTSRVYVVKSVDSDTQVTLTTPVTHTTGAGYTFAFAGVFDLNFITGYKTGPYFATLADKLLVATGNRVDVSAGRSDTGDFQPHVFDATNYILFAGDVLGMAPVRDIMLVFTTAGVYAWSNLALDYTDADGNFQWSIDPLNADRILWGDAGIATYGNELIAPCTDGIWSIGAVSAPTLVSRSINALYRSYVSAGHKPGLATIYRSHYHLPILNAANEVVDHLVCRLDRPVDTSFGLIFPWGQWDGHGGDVTALAVRVGGATTSRLPKLLAASRAANSRILDLSRAYSPAADVKNDADATTHVWQVELRDFLTGGSEFINTVRLLGIRYELIDADVDNPEIQGFWSIGAEIPGLAHWDEVNWDEFMWVGDETEFQPLDGTAPESRGIDPHTWPMSIAARYVRARLRCEDPCASLVLRSVEWGVRPRGKEH